MNGLAPPPEARDEPHGGGADRGRIDLPRVAVTLGDVAGIGPEVVARACDDPAVAQCARIVVVGDAGVLERALRLVGSQRRVRRIDAPAEWNEAATLSDSATSGDEGREIACWSPRTACGAQRLAAVAPGKLDGAAGQAAYDWLVAAAGAALAGSIDAIVTAPLNKAALHLAGLNYPGHTEILAQTAGVPRYAMMLFVPPGAGLGGPHGIGVAHVTLHAALSSVAAALSVDGVAEKIGLLHAFLMRIGAARPRIGVCAFNPHAGESGLFGDEEARIIAPAVGRSVGAGVLAEGPIAADALFRRAIAGEFDGVVAMYHDQGHIPIKLVAREAAVNVTLGLPIVRTSPSHGTAFDIAWQGKASALGMIEAIRTASLLARPATCRPAGN